MINSYSLDLSRVFSGAIDKIIILPLFGLTILGNYQLGIQFLSLLILVPGIVYQYTLPQDSTGNRNEKLKKITILASVLLAVLGIFLAPLILPVMFPKFSKAIEVIQIMSLGVIPVTIISTYISKFMGSLKSKVVLIGSLIYIVIQILSILILGKLFGIHGVAAAIVLANASEAIYLMLIDRRIKNKDSAESIL
jgi:O-antigen/teichoic acid export membrane protein